MPIATKDGKTYQSPFHMLVGAEDRPVDVEVTSQYSKKKGPKDQSRIPSNVTQMPYNALEGSSPILPTGSFIPTSLGTIVGGKLGDGSHIPIDRSGSVPYGAGSIEKDGQFAGVAVDKRVPKETTIDGVKFDPAQMVAYHEFAEYKKMKELMSHGVPEHVAYTTAHIHAGNPAEKEAVYGLARQNGKDPVDFYHKYQGQWKDWLHGTEHEKVKDVPEGLYDKPYPHTEQHILEAHEAHSQPHVIGGKGGENIIDAPDPKPGTKEFHRLQRKDNIDMMQRRVNDPRPYGTGKDELNFINEWFPADSGGWGARL